MTTDNLTRDQRAFLEECNLEFSDRFTDADLEFKRVRDAGVPPPPIMHPWYGRSRLTANRSRAGGSRHSDGRSRDRGHDNRDCNRESRDRGYEGRGSRESYKRSWDGGYRS